MRQGEAGKGLRSFAQKEAEALVCGGLGTPVLVKRKQGPVLGLLGEIQAKDKTWGTRRCWGPCLLMSPSIAQCSS